MKARNAASTWCRCYKCDGIARNIISENEPAIRFRCNKDKLETCLKWYDAYRGGLLVLDSVIEE